MGCCLSTPAVEAAANPNGQPAASVVVPEKVNSAAEQPGASVITPVKVGKAEVKSGKRPDVVSSAKFNDSAGTSGASDLGNASFTEFKARGGGEGEDDAGSRSSFGNSDNDDDDSDSDWDRYSASDEVSSSTNSRGTGDATAAGDEPSSTGGRRKEKSLFGVADKRTPMGLKETASLKLAKLRGVTFVNQYVVIKYLGRGACGRVFLCMDMYDNRLYAVKIVKKVELEAQRKPGRGRKRNPIEDLRREVAIMRTLRHKNIVSLQEVVDDPSGNKMLLVMDYMEGGPVMTRDALERGRCIPEPLALQYFRDMCKALDYLHFNKVVHGDLKPENVLMSARGAVTLSDFGCSKLILSGNEYLERCNGTPAFLAPEMMRPQSRYRGRPTDVYALGACLFTFVYGRIPFNAPNVFKLFQVVQTEPLRFPEDVPTSDDLKDLLTKMLAKDPTQRITLQKVMQHPWVTKQGAWPLRTMKEMLRSGAGPDDDDDDLENFGQMPDLMSTVNVLDVPRQDHLLELLRPGLMEREYKDGEYLLRQGDQGTSLLYIVEGQVEVLLKLQPPKELPAKSSRGEIGGAPADEADEPPPTVGGVSRSGGYVPEVIGEELPPALLEGASKAREFTTLLGRGTNEYLVAIRSEGQFIGEMSSFASSAARCASVRAKGPVRAKLIPGEHLHKCVERIPEARQQVKEMVWMKQSENMVLEAVTRLSSVHDALEELLAPALPTGRKGASDQETPVTPNRHSRPPNAETTPPSSRGSEYSYERSLSARTPTERLITPPSASHRSQSSRDYGTERDVGASRGDRIYPRRPEGYSPLRPPDGRSPVQYYPSREYGELRHIPRSPYRPAGAYDPNWAYQRERERATAARAVAQQASSTARTSSHAQASENGEDTDQVAPNLVNFPRNPRQSRRHLRTS
eukprot:jgi/Botrbrau1/13657/Bobra.0292s0007.1